MLAIRNLYELLSGQKVSLSKSLVYFSRHVDQGDRTTLASFLGCQFQREKETIWGCHTLWRGIRRRFSAVYEKELQRKHEGWKEKYLSHTRKEILIKSVLQ